MNKNTMKKSLYDKIISSEGYVFTSAFALLLFSRHTGSMYIESIYFFKFVKNHSGDFNWVLMSNILFGIKGAILMSTTLVAQELGLVPGGHPDHADIPAILVGLAFSIFYEIIKRKNNHINPGNAFIRRLNNKTKE